MAAKMAAKNLILMYHSSAFTYKDKRECLFIWSEWRTVQYEEINNNNCIIFKMATKMAAENQILVYLSSAFRYKDN